MATPLDSSVNGLALRDDSFKIGRSINTGSLNLGDAVDTFSSDPVDAGGLLSNDNPLIVGLNTGAPNPVVPSSSPGAIGQVSNGNELVQTGPFDSSQYLASASKMISLEMCATERHMVKSKFQLLVKPCPDCGLARMNCGLDMID